jgi:hypothetical protein
MTSNETLKGRDGGLRWLYLMGIVVPILISSCAGCKLDGSSSNSNEIKANQMTANDHEIEAKDQKTNLNSNEMKGLQPMTRPSSRRTPNAPKGMGK